MWQCFIVLSSFEGNSRHPLPYAVFSTLIWTWRHHQRHQNAKVLLSLRLGRTISKTRLIHWRLLNVLIMGTTLTSGFNHTCVALSFLIVGKASKGSRVLYGRVQDFDFYCFVCCSYVGDYLTVDIINCSSDGFYIFFLVLSHWIGFYGVFIYPL